MPLAVARVTTPGTTPDRWMVFLHGILGSGANWRSFARQIISGEQARHPTWGAILVDLRLHGDSQGFSPPHTVMAAARDVATALGHETHDTPTFAVLGHSFGGKVAIEVAAVLASLGRPLEHLFVIDATPSARPDARGSESTREIVDLLTELPEELADRAAFTAWVEQRGVSRPVAMWLAMNVRPIPNTNRYTFRVDIAGVRALLDDYFRTDLWNVLENPPEPMSTHLIVGELSTAVDEADRERARACPRTTVDVVAGAGHWVHVDAPDALRELVVARLG